MKLALGISVVWVLYSSLASASTSRGPVEPSAANCPALLKTPATLGAMTLRVTADCVLEVQVEGRTAHRLSLRDVEGKPSKIRRIVSTPTLLYVLRTDPERLDVYTLPALKQVPVFGAFRLRQPTDLAVHEEPAGQPIVYILDNDPYAGHSLGPDDVREGARILRVKLDRHVSPRRDVLVAHSVDALASRMVRVDEPRHLEAIELQDNELRVTLVEDGARYIEYFTLGGLLLERERLGTLR